MPTLKNSRHEQFAQLIAVGKSASEAYIHAGFSAKGAKASAHRLLAHSHVSARVEELRVCVSQAAVTRASIDREFVINGLKENFLRAMQQEPVRDRDGNATGEYSYSGSVANRALELLGKELGMFVDRNQNVPMTLEQLRALPIFEQFLEQAATEAKRLGLDVDDEPPKGEPN